jgi:hypothetical protein
MGNVEGWIEEVGERSPARVNHAHPLTEPLTDGEIKDPPLHGSAWLTEAGKVSRIDQN